MSSRIAAALLTSLVSLAAFADDGGWETVATSPILVKTRQRPGSAVKEIWAEGDIAAPVRDIQATLMDPDRFSKFMPYVKEARTFGKPEPDGATWVYTRLEFPSFVSSRDYVLKVYLDQSVDPDGKGTFKNHWIAAPDRLPQRANAVRLKVNEGSWEITPKDEKTSHAVYKFMVDPGGWIPTFAADLGNKKGVADTFHAVEGEAQRRMKERPQAASR